MFEVKKYIKYKRHGLKLRKHCFFRKLHSTERVYVSCDLRNTAQVKREVYCEQVLQFSLDSYLKLKSDDNQNLRKLTMVKNAMKTVGVNSGSSSSSISSSSSSSSVCPCNDDEFWMVS